MTRSANGALIDKPRNEMVTGPRFLNRENQCRGGKSRDDRHVKPSHLRSRYISLNGALGPSVRALRAPSFKLTQPLLFTFFRPRDPGRSDRLDAPLRPARAPDPLAAIGSRWLPAPRIERETWHREPLWPACASQAAQVLPRTCRSPATLRTRILISSISYAKVDALRQLPVGVAVRVDVSAR